MPSGQISSIQRSIIDAVFGLFAASYIPGRLTALLNTNDAFEAIRLFLQDVGIEFNELCVSGPVREYFDYALGVLAEVDVVRRRGRFSDAPFYAALKTRDKRAIEALSDQLQRAARIADILSEATPTFPEHAAFLRTAVGYVEEWNSISAATLEEFLLTSRMWAELETEYSDLREAVRELIASLTTSAGEDSELERALPGIISTYRKLEASAAAGEVDAAGAIEEMEDFRRTLVELGATYETATSSEGAEEERLAECLRTLGLNYPSDLDRDKIKRAFRLKAKTCHVDAGGSDELMRAINEAKDTLFNYLESTITV